ncbi:potential GTPase activation protein, partial [Haematococcus lacustris]
MCSMKAGLRVKSISMGKFSPEEVKQLEEGGNELTWTVCHWQVAASKYLAKWKAEGDARRPNSKNHMAVEAWVLTVLVDKRYYSDNPASPATSSPGSQGQGSSHIPVRPMSELLGASQVKLQVGST